MVPSESGKNTQEVPKTQEMEVWCAESYSVVFGFPDRIDMFYPCHIAPHFPSVYYLLLHKYLFLHINVFFCWIALPLELPRVL